MVRRLSDEHLLAAAALIVPSLGFLGALGLAPFLSLIAIGLVLTAKRPRVWLARSLFPLAALLALLALWSAISAIWSIIPGHSLFEAGRLAIISASGLVIVSAALALDPGKRAMVGRASFAGFLLGVAIVVIELVGDFPIRHALSGGVDREFVAVVLDRGAIVLALACWAPILHLIEQRRPVVAAGVLLATALTLGRLVNASAVLGLATAALTLPLAWWRPRAIARVLIAGFIALTIAFPFLPPNRDGLIWLNATAPWLRNSGVHRLMIWRFTSDRIAERPLLGWGMDASRAIPGGKTPVREYLGLPSDFMRDRLEGSVLQLHPHDAILQWWVELGILGTALGVAIVVWVIWRTGTAGSPSQAARATGLAVIAAALPPLLLSFGVWQAWWQSALWLTAALTVAAGRQAPGGLRLKDSADSPAEP